MTTTDLDTLTDQFAKSNSTMFPTAEKLTYYNIGYGLLYGLIIDEQEDTLEAEPTAITTLANTGNYAVAARLHHVNWVKVNYGDGLIPATYKSYQDLILEYGSVLESTLDGWSASDPIYWYENSEINIRPKPTTSQAGASRLQYSAEVLPSDMTAGQSPAALDANFHYLLAVYAALTWLDEDDPLWDKRYKEWNEGRATMLKTMFPRVRQGEMQAHVFDDDGSEY
jgi:hypothetical protein